MGISSSKNPKDYVPLPTKKNEKKNITGDEKILYDYFPGKIRPTDNEEIGKYLQYDEDRKEKILNRFKKKYSKDIIEDEDTQRYVSNALYFYDLNNNLKKEFNTQQAGYVKKLLLNYMNMYAPRLIETMQSHFLTNGTNQEIFKLADDLFKSDESELNVSIGGAKLRKNRRKSVKKVKRSLNRKTRHH